MTMAIIMIIPIVDDLVRHRLHGHTLTLVVQVIILVDTIIK